ncbi:hypothetical protein V6M85_07255 [Sulfolobus tengchongensis]|uniref:Uncharacterized protein n=1 Tax=Sulfolobus tengchongensis TaxID=207809 RepID=A0AAX4KZG4_9CREN
MKNSQLWLAGAGLTILQILIGNVMLFYGILPSLLGLHIVLAIAILIIAIYGYLKSKLGIERRILMGNVGLIIVISVLGYLYTFDSNAIILIFHFILALGILSNFSVLYGFDRGQNYK